MSEGRKKRGELTENTSNQPLPAFTLPPLAFQLVSHRAEPVVKITRTAGFLTHTSLISGSLAVIAFVSGWVRVLV
jgi:hypothetical protein